MVESRKGEVDISLTTLASMKEVIGRTQNPSLILRALPVSMTFTMRLNRWVWMKSRT